MIQILKPKNEDLEPIIKILSQWTDKEQVEKYQQRIINEINGQTEFNMQFWIAKEMESVLGVIGLSDILPKIASYAKTERPGEIKILYVNKESRGKGIGRMFVDFIEKEAIRQGYQELLVRSAERYRETAYGFYEKMDYQAVGVTTGGDSTETMTVFQKRLDS